MTETTGTTGTTGPRPLWKAFDEAVVKNGWKLGGVAEQAVLWMAFAKMVDAWGTYASSLCGCGFPFGRYVELLRFGDGCRLCLTLARAGVVRMTEGIGVDAPEERRMVWLCRFFTKHANWVFGTCLKSGFSLDVIRFCTDSLTREAGCDDEAYVRCSPTPVMFPPGNLSQEETEKMLASIKKRAGGEA